MSNINQVKDVARSTSFFAVVPSLTELVLTTQSINVPGVNLGNSEIYKNRANKNIFASNTLNFEPIVLQFVVSEDHSEWIALYKWMVDCVKSVDHNENQKSIEVQVLDNQAQRLFSYIYKGCLITNLSSIRFVSNEEEQTLVSDATIEIEKMVIEYPDGTVIDLIDQP